MRIRAVRLVVWDSCAKNLSLWGWTGWDILSPELNHHVLAHQSDGGSRVFDYAIVKYGRRSRRV